MPMEINKRASMHFWQLAHPCQNFGQCYNCLSLSLSQFPGDDGLVIHHQFIFHLLLFQTGLLVEIYPERSP